MSHFVASLPLPLVEKQMHGKTVAQRLWIDGRERKFNPLFPGSVERLLHPQPDCFPADCKLGALTAGSERGQIAAKLIYICGIEQRHYSSHPLTVVPFPDALFLCA